MKLSIQSRRDFLSAVGNLSSAGWVALNWPQIALAAEGTDHSGHQAGMAGHEALTTLTSAEARDVDAIVNLIVPGGATPGAREARSLNFIDNALGSFFATQLPAFRSGLAEFQQGFASKNGTATSFANAPEQAQAEWLAEMDETAFFQAVRRLTVLGLLAMPQYGGNYEGIGWKLINVVDSHYWEPPFGYYDQDYPGFEPYPGTSPYTA